jgi:hypothetical protein
MPKVKTMRLDYAGRKFEANLTVRSDGNFYAPNPLAFLNEDPEVTREPERISGPNAEDVERDWKDRTRDAADMKSTTRKVILIEFDSTLREGGADFFTQRGTTLKLKAAIAIETTTTIGDKTTTSFEYDPTYRGLHCPESPIPLGFRLKDGLNWGADRKTRTVVEWSPETEALVVKACEGIREVVRFFENLTAEPLRIPDIARHVAAGLPGLPFFPNQES